VILMSVIVIAAAVAFIRLGAKLTATPSGVDVVTYHNDIARTGQNLNETILTPANVKAATFGKVGFFPVDGKVDAQPLLLSGVAIPGQGTHDVLYIATENDSVYGLDAATGAVLWYRPLLMGTGESPSDADNGCGQVGPEIGITSTPVIDRSAGVIYLVAMSKSGSTYFQRLHALDVTSGTELSGSPVTVTAAGFVPELYEERAALLLLSGTPGTVVTSWTSHCDGGAYNGWIMAYNASTLVQTSVLNVTPHGSRGAFWMAGGGPAADSSGNVYLLGGNGTFDPPPLVNWFPSQRDFGNAFIKVSTSGALAVADYFANWDTINQSNADLDLGSGGTIVLPDLFDVNSIVHHLAVGGGKDGHIYVANRDSMGHINTSTNDNSNIYQDLVGALPGGSRSTPAYFNGTVYYGGTGDPLKAFSIVNAMLVPTPASKSAQSFAYPGTTPGISASGNANGIVWAVQSATGSPAVLHAYDPANLIHEFYNSNQAAAGRDGFGNGNKFITPTIVNGRVYVGTPTGVAAFGLLGTGMPPTTVTGAATAITKTGATLNGTANPNGVATTASFQYGLTTAYGSTTPVQAIGSGMGAVAIGGGAITGLACNTSYHFRVVATNAFGTTTGTDAPFAPLSCPTGDFDGDGTSDLLWRHQATGQNVVWLMNGLTVATSAFLPTVGDTNWEIKGTGDLDGDGKSDLIWRHKVTGQVVGWLMNGLTLSSSALLATVTDTNWEIKGIGDLDGDGKADLLWRHKVTGQVVGWLMNGLTLSNSVSLPTVADTNWEIKGIGDLDGDGKADVVWRHKVTGQVVGWLMNGLTVANSAFLPTVTDTNWEITGVGDLDGDGKADLIWRHSVTGQNVGWLMNGLTLANSALLPTVADTNWEIAGIGDLNGDGKADLIWRHMVTGQVVGWLMNGLTLANSALLPTVADTNWEIVGP
jgi:hypothetical protein